MKVSKVLIENLNNLLTRNRDVQNAYVMTSNHINSPELSKWMVEYSNQRNLFAQQLGLEIRSLEGEPEDSTSAIGELRHVWIDMKGVITNNDPLAMLEECKKGEERALEDYDEVLKQHGEMPKLTMNMLNRHKSKIMTALTQIKAMMKMYVPVEH